MAGRRARLNPLDLLEATGRPVVLGLDWVLAFAGLSARAVAAIGGIRQGPAQAEFMRTLRLALPGALFSVVVAALVVGTTLIGQGLFWLTFADQAGLVRTLMVEVLTRELAPVLVALVLLARIGTRNLVELSAIRAGPAWRGLASQGVDVFRVLVAPRAAAAALAGFSHTVIAVILAALGGHLTALVLGASTLRPLLFLASILDGMRITDFLLVALKGPALGFTVAMATAITALASGSLAARPEVLLPRGIAVATLAVITVSLLLSVLL